jgi:hypothetical protein
VLGADFQICERRLGLGLYFGHAVVREPQPRRGLGRFRYAPPRCVTAELAWSAPKNAAAGRPARFHQNDAPMEKSAILVCSGHIKGRIQTRKARRIGLGKA